MKKMCLLVAALYVCCVSMGQTVYSVSVQDIDGNSINFTNNYAGSKILFFIAPVKSSDSIRLKDISALQSQQGSAVKMVGILSYEDGYVDSNKAAIKAMYLSKGITATLTEGLHTKTSATNTIAGLMNWLTSITQNTRMNIGVKGVGQKFFVSKTGYLYATLPPEVPFASSLSNRNINVNN